MEGDMEGDDFYVEEEGYSLWAMNRTLRWSDPIHSQQTSVAAR